MKISLSTLSASVLACLGMMQVNSAYAVPNPVAFIEETQDDAGTTVADAAVLTEQMSAEIVPPVSADANVITKPNPMAMPAESPTMPSITIDEKAMLINCSTLIQDAMRLACYDALAVGDTPSQTEAKRSIKLGDTILQTIKGKPQVIYNESKPETDRLFAIDEQGQSTKESDRQLEQIAKRFTPLSLAYDLDRNNAPLWSTRPHNPMYILPLYINGKPNREPQTPTQHGERFTPNDLRATELKFQLSFKVKAAENLLGTDADLWFGYTQQSHWQVYNENKSRPFRVHDYQPELFVTQPVHADLPFGGKLRMLGAGVVHHSNGEDNPLSRSWNRAYLMAGMEWDKLTVMPRLWTRVVKNDSGAPDDNPDVLDYYGYGDVRFLYQLENKSNISGTVRYNPGTHKGALQLDYVRPLGRGVSGYVQLFQGYGQSFIDYNHESTSIGVGLMLNDWMGL
ncbi:phospholipase A [Moraxella marmotae]|uniref:phospholipase A n=1 Tax=Moraxella marmotae TaxID=3344520 RepID=UPI0035F428BA